jgi:uncharacterized cofD-like protein
MPVPSTKPVVTALGGGHGLAASLRALRHVTDRITAVVTVADDGGSSGRLRDELGVLPPGDLREALVALTDDSDWGRTWSTVLQYRFTSAGPLDYPAAGNLVLAALWGVLGDPVVGLDWLGRLLDARGRVLPMSMVPLVVEADVRDGETLRTVVGQVNVATADGRIENLRLLPAEPPACPEAVAAIDDADWVVLGPGSWYSSVLVHLLVPQLRAALHRTRARRLVTLNLSPDDETTGLTAVDLLDALHRHAPELRIDVVLADRDVVVDVADVEAAAARLGARVEWREVEAGGAHHDTLLLAAAYRDIFAG